MHAIFTHFISRYTDKTCTLPLQSTQIYTKYSTWWGLFLVAWFILHRTASEVLLDEPQEFVIPNVCFGATFKNGTYRYRSIYLFIRRSHGSAQFVWANIWCHEGLVFQAMWISSLVFALHLLNGAISKLVLLAVVLLVLFEFLST